MGDRARGIIANALELNYPTRIEINYKLIPPDFGETPDINPTMFFTTGLYCLSYKKYTHSGAVNMKRFCIKADFVNRQFIKFFSWHDLQEQAKTNDHVKFLLEYTNLNEQMLNIAAQNEDMRIPFCLDIVKYDKEVRPKTGKKPDEYAMIYNPYKTSVKCDWEQRGEYAVLKDEEANK